MTDLDNIVVRALVAEFKRVLTNWRGSGERLSHATKQVAIETDALSRHREDLDRLAAAIVQAGGVPPSEDAEQ